ncbi:hypothetical protein BDZ89DRAFT_124554 [Hymenopellis radicata]|nr:hypothetical protein BDZ89DRAFT_124554 [Hymenopellis radicata]
MSVSLCTQCGTISKPSLQYVYELETSILLHNLRSSNLPATDQESSHIQHNILPNIDTDISSISAKIRSLQDVIASLQQERDALENVRERYRGLISLCRAVPLNSGSKSSSYVHEDEQIDDEDFTVSHPTCSIWDMAKVCQTWRGVAVSLHSCWTKLRLEFPEDGKTERDLWALEVALQRSGQHPLDITLISGYNPADFDPSFRNRMLAMVHAESHRWRDARLLEYDMNSDILYAPLRGRLPMLESLYLFLSGEFDIDRPVDEQSVLTVFNDCPRLAKVDLTGTQLVQLPWAQIRELRLEDRCRIWVDEACRQFVGLVGRCPNLQVLQARASRSKRMLHYLAPSALQFEYLIRLLTLS